MDLNYVIRLVADFFKEKGLLKTYACLIQEAGLPSYSAANELCAYIDKEDWPGLLS